jgi:hypothetical protein
MLLSQLFKIIFVLFAISGALIYKIANIVISKLLLSSEEVSRTPEAN